MKSLANKVVIITGAGRSQGMGQAAANKFAEHGTYVMVTDLVRAAHKMSPLVSSVARRG